MLLEIVEEYKTIQNNVDLLIKKSGFKLGFVSDKMGMDKTSFYLKRKNANFSLEEIEKLLNIIRANELEDGILAEMSLESESDSELIEWQDVRSTL
jgi:hypothetical protein